ncbi:MAG: hypothetical protein AB7I50_10640 [Vicinamibacterales bacterium]
MNHLSLFASTGSPFSNYCDAAHSLGVVLTVAVDSVGALATRDTITGVIALDRQAALVAAQQAEASGVMWHPVGAVRAATHAVAARGRWLAAGLPCLRFVTVPEGESLTSVVDRVRLPCVVRDAAGAFSVLAETFDACESAVAVARRQGQASTCGPDFDDVLLEAFAPGEDYIIHAVMDRGTLHVLAILEGDALSAVVPGATRTFITPPALTGDQQRLLAGVFAHAAHALGLHHGPVQGTCRASEAGLFVLDVAPYPVSYPFSRALRFVDRENQRVTFEELVLRHACGESLDAYAREGLAVGAAIVKPAGDGDRLDVRRVVEARRVRFIDDLCTIDAPGNRGQREGACVIIARAVETGDVTQAVAEAERRLSWIRGEPTI